MDYQRVEKDVRRLLGDTDAVAVTTFIDYYGLPSSFPGMTSRPFGDPGQRVGHVEAEWENQIGDKRFHSYLMTHEFEALLFSKPDEIIAALYGRKGQLDGILASFSSPEEINEGPETAPSKRIESIFRGYRKAVYGPLIASRIGLQVIREQCMHFDEWLGWIESL
jgi:hypothetical protein